MSHETEKEFRDEVRKEFQLERMILFSDAVFAIVITLMAIEIRLPEFQTPEGADHIRLIAEHVVPTIFAYFISFLFIGGIWYQHLQTFRLLKDYDKGLVLRNLILLFFIGLFPFGATFIVKEHDLTIKLGVYVAILFACSIAQLFLQRYILIDKPQLRISTDIRKDLEELYTKQTFLILLIISVLLVIVTMYFIPDPEQKPIALLWAFAAFLYRVYVNRKKKKLAAKKATV